MLGAGVRVERRGSEDERFVRSAMAKGNGTYGQRGERRYGG